jgi:amidase
VAAGFTSFELGTDIGGSVRVPAHFCGIYGLKPSYGVVPQRGYLDHPTGGTTDADINVFGPLARSPEDLALLLGVLAGPLASAAVGWRLELPPPPAASLSGYRVGLWLDDPACPVARDYAACLERSVGALGDAGARIEDRHPPADFAAQVDVFSRLIMAAVSPALPDADADAFSGSHRGWLRADQERARLRQVWADWFADYDVLLCPVNLGPAFHHDHAATIMERVIEIDGVVRSHIEYGSWPGLIGVIGLPSAVVPIGRTATGLPVGMQIVAPHLRDRSSVEFARLASEVLGGYEPPPGY